MSEQCSTCRFFKAYAIAGSEHVCRRHPPRPNGMSHGGIARSDFPIVRGDDWCGEWTGERVVMVRAGDPFLLPAAGEGRMARIVATHYETWSHLLVEVQDDDGTWVPGTSWEPRSLVNK